MRRYEQFKGSSVARLERVKCGDTSSLSDTRCPFEIDGYPPARLERVKRGDTSSSRRVFSHAHYFRVKMRRYEQFKGSSVARLERVKRGDTSSSRRVEGVYSSK